MALFGGQQILTRNLRFTRRVSLSECNAVYCGKRYRQFGSRRFLPLSFEIQKQHVPPKRQSIFTRNAVSHSRRLVTVEVVFAVSIIIHACLQLLFQT